MFVHLPAYTWQLLGVVVIAAAAAVVVVVVVIAAVAVIVVVIVVVIDRWGGKRGEVGSPLGTCNNGKQHDILFRWDSSGGGNQGIGLRWSIVIPGV